jgi:UDP-N-acetyl-D-mannosaminuronate dehydrogenase
MSLPVEARRVNDSMAAWAVDRLEQALGNLQGKRVLLLGLAYRENVKETAFSAAVRLVGDLRGRGAKVFLNDPLYTDGELARYAEPASLDSLPECDAAIMQACHDAYRGLDWQALSAKGCKAVLDGRDCLDRDEIERAGMAYLGMGR